MRKDIQINTAIGDIVLKDQNGANIYPFQWVSEGDLFLFGQITLPFGYDISKLPIEGVRVTIPYTPIYKPIKFRIVRQFDEEHEMVYTNPVDGTEWYEAYTKLWGQQTLRPCASQLLIISANVYTIQLDIKDGKAYIWSGNQSDAVNINANIQNRNLLLRCIPSNNYRYPTSGVGLVRYLHANLSRTGLADLLQTEFKADKVTVKNASFDSYSGDLDLDLDFSEADASV